MPFDSAAMLVAQSRRHPARFVVAIRGTNPVSLYDWVFGDLTVTRQVPWPYDTEARDAGARISFSSAFGLSILQHLRWEPPEPKSASGLWHALGEAVTSSLSGASLRLTQRLEPVTGDAVRTLRGRIQSSLGVLTDWNQEAIPDRLDDRLEVLYERHAALRASPFGRALDEALDRLEETPLDPLRLVLGGAALRRMFASGASLQSFLKEAVSDAEAPVEIVVTGHSKGGALSSTLALWLADTQGTSGVPEEDVWDPERRATVHAFSFAGPTAGNESFARHSDHVIGPRCHRVENGLDVVPHAWEVETLREVPDLFAEPVHRPDVVRRLIDDLVEDVAPLGYRQIGGHVTRLPGVLDPSKRWFIEQTVHQHLDGYLQQMGLDDEMTMDTFFDPFQR